MRKRKKKAPGMKTWSSRVFRDSCINERLVGMLSRCRYMKSLVTPSGRPLALPSRDMAIR